jgi:CRP-like cAMP-binding protein
VILNVQQPGDVFGLGGMLMPDHHRIGSAIALTPVESRSLAWSQFEELRRSDPRVERFMSHVLAMQMRRLMGYVLESLYVPVEVRVLRRVDELCDILGRVQGHVIEIRVRQDDIAAMAGTTRPTANRALRAAEARGLIRLSRGCVEVLDRPALAARAR